MIYMHSATSASTRIRIIIYMMLKKIKIKEGKMVMIVILDTGTTVVLLFHVSCTGIIYQRTMIPCYCTMTYCRIDMWRCPSAKWQRRAWGEILGSLPIF